MIVVGMGVRRCLVVVLALPAVMLGVAAPAAAQDGAEPPPVQAWFVRDSLIYPNTPDGWACHFLGQCRPPGLRIEDDPGPIAVVPDGQNVDLICVFGSYAKVTTTAAPESEPPPTQAAAPERPSTTKPSTRRQQPPPPTPAATSPPTPLTITTRIPKPPSASGVSEPRLPAAPAEQASTTTPPASGLLPGPSTSATAATVPVNPLAPSALPPGSVSSLPPPSRPAAAAPPTATGSPAKITEPVRGWAPVADIDAPTNLRAGSCTVDQWAR